MRKYENTYEKFLTTAMVIHPYRTIAAALNHLVRARATSFSEWLRRHLLPWILGGSERLVAHGHDGATVLTLRSQCRASGSTFGKSFRVLSRLESLCIGVARRRVPWIMLALPDVGDRATA